MRTHYTNLKIQETATAKEIRAAYRSLAQKWHPDKNDNKKLAERNFKIIKRSYETLSCPIKKAKHDEWIKNKRSYQKEYEREYRAQDSAHNTSYDENPTQPEQETFKESAPKNTDNKSCTSLSEKVVLTLVFSVMSISACLCLADYMNGLLSFAGALKVVAGLSVSIPIATLLISLVAYVFVFAGFGVSGRRALHIIWIAVCCLALVFYSYIVLVLLYDAEVWLILSKDKQSSYQITQVGLLALLFFWAYPIYMLLELVFEIDFDKEIFARK